MIVCIVSKGRRRLPGASLATARPTALRLRLFRVLCRDCVAGGLWSIAPARRSASAHRHRLSAPYVPLIDRDLELSIRFRGLVEGFGYRIDVFINGHTTDSPGMTCRKPKMVG